MYYWCKRRSGASPDLLLCFTFYLQIVRFFWVGLPGLEPGTSSLSEKCDVLPEVFRVCKIPANRHILRAMLFLNFQDICLGCCTVAATNLPLPYSVLR